MLQCSNCTLNTYYKATRCLFVALTSDVTEIAAGTVMSDLMSVAFTSTVTVRPSLTFSVAFIAGPMTFPTGWNDNNGTFFQDNAIWYDPEEQALWAHQPGIALTAQLALDLCASLGSRWLPATPHSATDSFMMQRWYSGALQENRKPIGIGYDPSINKYGSPLATEPADYSNWDTNYPDSPVNAAEGCVYLSYSTGGVFWRTRDCTLLGLTWKGAYCKRHNHIDDHLTHTVTWMPNLVAATNAWTPSFPSLPAPSSTLIFGATFQTINVDCRDLDIVVFTANHDSIVSLSYSKCLWWLTGTATVTDYNSVLSGIEYRYSNPYRTSARFSFVYWSTPNFRKLVIDGATLTVYGFVPTVGRWTPLAGYNHDPLSAKCGVYAMDPVELHTINAAREQQLVQIGGSMYIGGVRNTGVMTWVTSNVAMQSNDWFPLEPGAVYDCTAKSATGAWYTVDCQSQQRGIGCHTTTWPYKGVSGVYTSSLTVDPTTSQIVPFNVPIIYPFTLTRSYSWVSDTATLYGVTVELSVHTCRPNDMLGVSAIVPGGMTMHWTVCRATS